MSNLLEAIHSLNKSKDSTAPGSIHIAIMYAYSEPHRRYHDTRHLYHLLDLYDEVLDEIPYAVPVSKRALFALALAEHDIVYITGYKDSVEASANLAHIHGKMLGMSQKDISSLKVLVQATEHSCESDAKLKKKGTSLWRRLIRDMDLAILGTPWKQFRQYDADVEQEFLIAGCDSESFMKSRREFLESYLMKDRIYFTDYFHNRFDRQTRENLVQAVDGIYNGRT